MNNHVESWRCERWDHRYGTIPGPESSARAPCKKIQQQKWKKEIKKRGENLLLQRARTENKTNTTPTSDRRFDKRWPSDIVTFRHAGYLLAGAITKIKKKKEQSAVHLEFHPLWPWPASADRHSTWFFTPFFSPCLFYRDLLPAIVFFCFLFFVQHHPLPETTGALTTHRLMNQPSGCKIYLKKKFCG